MKPTHRKMTLNSPLDTSPTRIPTNRPTRTGAPNTGYVRARIRPVSRSQGNLDWHADGHPHARTGGGLGPQSESPCNK